MTGWRAYYADGSTVDSTEMEPSNLPDGVVCVVEFMEPPYREIHAGGDWYVWNGESWRHTQTGVWGEWRAEPEEGVAVRSTERLPDEQYEAVLNNAMEDDEWPT